MNRTYGLIGFPLQHSFSKQYFTEKFRLSGIDANYEIFEIQDISMFPEFLSLHPHLQGFNVTIPYKQSIISYLNSLDAEAAAIGAVNTVLIDRSNKNPHLKGFNTDAPAFSSVIKSFTSGQLGQAMILGNGGAARSAAYVLENLGWKVIYIARQSQQHSPKMLSYQDIDAKLMDETMLIVNASPVGMFPDSESAPAIPYHLLNWAHYLFDMVYNPSLTRFLEKGAAMGAKTCNGMGMLVKQADLAWQLWNSYWKQ